MVCRYGAHMGLCLASWLNSTATDDDAVAVVVVVAVNYHSLITIFTFCSACACRGCGEYQESTNALLFVLRGIGVRSV